MVFLAKDVKNGYTYLYLRHNHSVNGKSKRTWQISLGREDRIQTAGEVTLDTKIHTKTLEFGLVAALFQVAEKIGLVEVVNRVAGKRDQGISVGEHVLLAAVNRCVQPVSKKQLRQWINSTILRKIYPTLDANLDAHSYWDNFRYLTGKVVCQVEDEVTRESSAIWRAL